MEAKSDNGILEFNGKIVMIGRRDFPAETGCGG
jgi:hypothetical protein